MKLIIKPAAVIILALLFASCQDRFPSGYILELPEVPQSWYSLLGEPHWRLEWFDPSGFTQRKDIPPGILQPLHSNERFPRRNIEIELPVTWVNPVTAWPYWPEQNLIPGFFKPAGALFPFDISGKKLCLSWKSGPDTLFYRELALANDRQEAKIPANFDWLRFRELFNTEVLNEAVRRDPWLVDWAYVAERTISSNFDRRRLVPQAGEPLRIPVPSGPWYGTSPFADALFFAEGETPVFIVRPGINVWISAGWILRINGRTWVLTEMVNNGK